METLKDWLAEVNSWRNDPHTLLGISYVLLAFVFLWYCDQAGKEEAAKRQAMITNSRGLHDTLNGGAR